MSKQTKSELFRDLLPLLNSGRITLPRNDRLVHQIVSLERRVAAGGRETITHADRGHDDIANAAAGAAKLSEYGDYNFWWPLGPEEDGNENIEPRQPFPLMVAGGVTVQ